MRRVRGTGCRLGTACERWVLRGCGWTRPPFGKGRLRAGLLRQGHRERGASRGKRVGLRRRHCARKGRGRRDDGVGTRLVNGRRADQGLTWGWIGLTWAVVWQNLMIVCAPPSSKLRAMGGSRGARRRPARSQSRCARRGKLAAPAVGCPREDPSPQPLPPLRARLDSRAADAGMRGCGSTRPG